MIDFLYKSYKISKTRLVKKTRQIEEKILVSPEHYICGRCGQSFQYGDNSKEPEKCPRCICIKCGKSLMDRPKHHKLCGHCWGMGTYGKSYFFKTEHIDAVYEIKTVEVIEEVEDAYTEESLRLVDVPQMEYKVSNKEIHKNVDIDDLLNIELEVKDLSKNEYWFAVSNSFDSKKELRGESNKKIIDFSSLQNISTDDIIVDEKQVLIEFNDVVGFYPNIPAYLMGHPLNMYNNIRKNEFKINRCINIIFNTAIDSQYDAVIYKNRGIILYNLISRLQELEISVGLNIVDCSFIDGETLVINSFVSNDFIKKRNDLIYNILTKACFPRVVIKAYKDKLIKQKIITEEWSSGYGFELNDVDFKKIYPLEGNDILINNISDLGIKGNDLGLDVQSVLKKLDIEYDEFEVNGFFN